MGQEIDPGSDQKELGKQFTETLLKDLRALEILLERNMIESGVERIGAEQEFCLVSRHWTPSPNAMEILKTFKDPHVVNEYALFNMEINLDPQPFSGPCFSAMQTQLETLLHAVDVAAAKLGSKIVLAGILPTIRKRDLELDNMAPLERYRVIDENLKRMRGGRPFDLYIQGADQLIASHTSSLAESANTSFQIHLQVSPDAFADHYNFAQLISAPLLSVGVNSALLFGKRLWRETRIALFQQSIDTRNIGSTQREQSPRVTFGSGWVKESPLEIFQDDLSRFRALLSIPTDYDPLEQLEAGSIPKLRALSLFNGTVYRWNRACYGFTNGVPHLRIENRVLPAGPTVVDEIANSAFWLGMMKAMPERYRDLPNKLSFDLAHNNLVAAAKTGLDTHFMWLDEKMVHAKDLILDELLPMAREGLTMAGVDGEDITKYLDIVQHRVEKRHTGAQWMFESFNRLKEETTRYEASLALTAAMYKRQQSGEPVHDWTLASPAEGSLYERKYRRIEQIMSTDLFTVHPDDLVDLATHIMKWKHIRHVPVEDEKGQLVGLITGRNLLEYLGTAYKNIKLVAVKDVMVADPISVCPDTPTEEAVRLMLDNKISCLPVVVDDKLVGMVTEHDFFKMSSVLLLQTADPED